MALPVLRNLAVYKGDSFSFTIRLRHKNANGSLGDGVDLTGATATAQIRATEDTAAVMAEFTCTVPDQTVAADKGKITISLTPTQTAALTTNGVYDIQVQFTDGTVKTYLKGQIQVTKEVTRV